MEYFIVNHLARFKVYSKTHCMFDNQCKACCNRIKSLMLITKHQLSSKYQKPETVGQIGY